MPSLLGRELTGEERIVEATLKDALDRQDKIAVRNTIRATAARRPEALFGAAIDLLDSGTGCGSHRTLLACLVECPSFLAELTDPEKFCPAQFLAICRRLKEIDDLIDVKLARLMPGRHEDTLPLPADAVLRLLDTLNAISEGPRLVLMLGHLTHHPNERIASKATMLMGRRLRNPHWVRQQMTSEDPRVRANVIEGLWGVNTMAARKSLGEALKDANNRVVGNALFGLHLLGDPIAPKMTRSMIQDKRANFRRTAAWLMGKMKKPEFQGDLHQALGDEDPAVVEAVRRASEEIEPTVAPLAETPAAKPDPQHEAAKEEGPPFDTDFVPRFDGRYIRDENQPDKV